MTAPQPARFAGGRRKREVAAALQVECPTCHAQPGQPCRGRRMRGPDACHTTRIRAAVKASKALAPLPWPGGEFELRLLCQRCGQEVDAQHPGYAVADRRAATERGKAHLAWRQAHPGQDPRKGLAPVPWRLLHRACDTARSQDDFHIAARDLRTARQLLHQSVRLTGKHWVADTNWQGLVAHIMRASAAQDPPDAVEAAQRHAEAAKRAALQADSDANGS